MVLFSLMFLFVAVQTAPLHQLEGEALVAAERNGFLSDDYERLHVTELSEKLSDSLHSLDMGRLRRRRETQETTKIHIPINGINYSLALEHPTSVLHQNAEIIVSNGSNSERKYLPATRSCHLVGGIDDHEGSASLSYCDRLRGFMVVDDVEYILEPLEDGQHLVAERRKPKEWPYGDLEIIIEEETTYFSESELPKTSQEVDTESKYGKPVVIELAVYCDEDMTKLLEKAKADTVQKKVDYILSKFNGVQYEYAKVKQLQRVVIFQIKKMVFFEINPDWFHVSNSLSTMLSSLCQWNKDKKPYDIVYMITGHKPISPIGLAWVGGACRANIRCGVSMGTSWGRYVAMAHEIGHLLGMHHDADTPCKSLPQKNLGLMGGKGTDFSNCSAEAFHKKLAKSNGKCLFTQNIPDNDVMEELKGVHLENIPSVMNVTHHQYCENLMGPGYRYREKEGMKYSCDRGYYCVQLKEGPDFGLIYRESAQGIVGMYCAPGKVCLKKQCLTYKLMELHTEWKERAGGWGNWSEWTSCSRCCGTGVKYSYRECNNPTPIQHHYCSGNEYRAELCNMHPCVNDSSDTRSLIKSRADETCKRLVKGNFLNPNSYKMTGRIFGWKGYDNVCDVHCDNDKQSNSRDAILPDGTPCSSPDPEFDVGSKTNIHMHCFRGKCQVFGCDGKFPAKMFGSDPKCKDNKQTIVG